jgi:hypothetical protein
MDAESGLVVAGRCEAGNKKTAEVADPSYSNKIESDCRAGTITLG